MFKVKDVSNLDLVFGNENVRDFLPNMKDIPDQFKTSFNKWNEIFNRWFFEGLDKNKVKFIVKSGIDKDKAIRHIKFVMSSFDLSHEHKKAGCSYLMSEFFEDIIIDNIDNM